MAEGAARERWLHTGHLSALIANCHRDPRRVRRPFRPTDFMPPAIAKEFQDVAPLTKQRLHALKPLFAKRTTERREEVKVQTWPSAST